MSILYSISFKRIVLAAKKYLKLVSLISQAVLRQKPLNPSNFLGERLTSVCQLISTQGFGLGQGLV